MPFILTLTPQYVARETGRTPPVSFADMSVDHARCDLARARGWAARCRPTCSGRRGGAAAAGRTMVRSPAAPSPVLFYGLLFADSRGGRWTRVIGATDDDDDVGFAGSGRWRRRGATYGVDRSTMANSQALTWCVGAVFSLWDFRQGSWCSLSIGGWQPSGAALENGSANGYFVGTTRGRLS